MAAIKLCSLVGDPTDIEGHRTRQFSLDRKVEALDVGYVVLVRVTSDSSRPAARAIEW